MNKNEELEEIKKKVSSSPLFVGSDSISSVQLIMPTVKREYKMSEIVSFLETKELKINDKIRNVFRPSEYYTVGESEDGLWLYNAWGINLSLTSLMINARWTVEVAEKKEDL